jgi:hypothetical protein
LNLVDIVTSSKHTTERRTAATEVNDVEWNRVPRAAEPVSGHPASGRAGSRQVEDANLSFVGASAPTVTGTTFTSCTGRIETREPGRGLLAGGIAPAPQA